MLPADAHPQTLTCQAVDRVQVLRQRLLKQRRELRNFDAGRDKLDQALEALDRMLKHLESKP
jgi:hypothetical protein